MGYSLKYINKIIKLKYFDFILIESDGSKIKPIKAPNFYEPLISKYTNFVIGSIGLKSINKKINNNNLHRSKKIFDLLKNKSSKNINEKNILYLITSNKGLFKNCYNKKKILFINQADNNYLIKKAKKIAFIAKKKTNIKYIYITSLKNNKNPIKLFK